MISGFGEHPRSGTKGTLPTERLLQFLPTAGRGGSEEYGLTIAKEAIRRGWEVHAAIPIHSPDLESLAKDYFAAGAKIHRVSIGPSGQRPPHSLFEVVPRVATAMRALLKYRPSVAQIVLPYPYFGLGPILAAARLGIASQVVFQLVTSADRSLGERAKKLYGWARARHQNWVAVSAQNRTLLTKIFGIVETDIELIYNGADAPNHHLHQHTRESTRAELGISADVTMVLGVGRLERQKGFDLLMRAVPHLVRDYPKTRFLIAGNGSEREELEKLILDYDLGRSVKLLGHRNDVSRLLIAADLFVFPSRFEGHPFALVEAMASGLPVVAASASGIPEIVKDGVAGVLFRAGDACDLLETMRRVFQNRGKWPGWAAAGASIAQRFGLKQMLDATFDSFRRLTILPTGRSGNP